MDKCEKFGKFLRILYYLCLNTGFLHGFLFLGLPRNANFLFSVLSPYIPRHSFLYVGVECCFAVFEMIMGLSAWAAGGTVYSFTFCIVANCLPSWTEIMKLEQFHTTFFYKNDVFIYFFAFQI